MLDKDLFARAIGIVKNSNTITVSKLSKELKTDQDKARDILYELEDLQFITEFGGYWACTDYAELN